MKLKILFFFGWMAISGFHVNTTIKNLAERDLVTEQLRKLSELHTQSEKNDDLKSFLQQYEANAISMPEYQGTLNGIGEIEVFYSGIFRKQNIKTFKRTSDEFIELGKTVIEIGTFKKEYTEDKTDTLIVQNGKYWNIWSIQRDGSFRLKGEAFGFFHHVKDPRSLTVGLKDMQVRTRDVPSEETMPFELRAYNALMEKCVRMRNGAMRSEFFTNDGNFMPFAHPTVRGIDKIKPYLIAYSSGDVTIDSVSVYTMHSEYIDDIVLEYYKFSAAWHFSPSASGKTEGKGIRIWKRQPDMSLKIYREIGMHNHLE